MIHAWPETIRYLIILLACLAAGLNVALVVHAPRVLNAATAWRVLLLGKTGLLAYVITVTWVRRHAPLTWHVPLLGVSLVVVLVGLFLLDQDYRQRNRG